MAVFNWLITVVETFPSDVRIEEQFDETFSHDIESYLSTTQYDDMSMPNSPNCQISRKTYENGRK